MENRVNICGICFDNVIMDEALGLMEKKIAADPSLKVKSSQLLVANQDIINKIKKDGSFSLDRLNDSFLIVPDGESIILAGKILGTPLKERVAGPDLMERFMRISAVKDYKNFFFGSTQTGLMNLTANLQNKFPGLSITGSYSPPFVKEFPPDENDRIIDMINSSGTDVLWVSLGCPKQEKWIMNNASRINVPVIAGIGAAFDFHSGNLKRAPRWIRKIKMEWFFRFLQEPLRLFDRYFIGGVSFMRKVMRQKSSAGQRHKNGGDRS
jgi:N-acetylglucosaminyldiphosphoundecaprenol N-acetyl-beta-D-mannosaminyltransferase